MSNDDRDDRVVSLFQGYYELAPVRDLHDHDRALVVAVLTVASQLNDLIKTVEDSTDQVVQTIILH